MFQFDTLSHRSSHSSLTTGKLGTVSAVSTPLQGSMESLNIQPLHRVAQPGVPGGRDDWEAKLLGYKKGAYDTATHDDSLSMTSVMSAASQATTGTLGHPTGTARIVRATR